MKNAKILSVLIALCSMLLALNSISCGGRFACKERIEGIKCETITSVYEKELLGEDARSKEQGAKSEEKEAESIKKEASVRQAHDKVYESTEIVRKLGLDEKKPVRVSPKIIRIWIAPWEDSDGDLHQPEYIYSEITDKRGRWLFGEKETSTSQPLLTPVTPEISKEKQEEPPEDQAVEKPHKHIDKQKK